MSDNINKIIKTPFIIKDDGKCINLYSQDIKKNEQTNIKICKDDNERLYINIKNTFNFSNK